MVGTKAGGRPPHKFYTMDAELRRIVCKAIEKAGALAVAFRFKPLSLVYMPCLRIAYASIKRCVHAVLTKT